MPAVAVGAKGGLSGLLASLGSMGDDWGRVVGWEAAARARDEREELLGGVAEGRPSREWL